MKGFVGDAHGEVFSCDVFELLHTHLKGDVHLGGEGLQLLFGGEVEAGDGDADGLLGEDVGIEADIDLAGGEFGSFDGGQREGEAGGVGNAGEVGRLGVGGIDGVQLALRGVHHDGVGGDFFPGDVVLALGRGVALDAHGDFFAFSLGVDDFQCVGGRFLDAGGGHQLAQYSFAQFGGEQAHVVAFLAVFVEVECEGHEALAEHVFHEHGAFVLQLQVEVLGDVACEYHVFGHILEAKGDGDVGFVLFVQCLKCPEG